MEGERSKGNRRSIRLKRFDYARQGAYFVTICTNERTFLLGEIAGGVMRLNEAGRMAENWWHRIPTKFAGVVTDQFVVTPNHVHGIVSIVGADPRVCPQPNAGEHVETLGGRGSDRAAS